ncbi:type II toxin-antitoxin system HicB family antitoxin [Campylobacter sp. MOP51]|uniref:type II toxin-antitoxin system HicB family antitoxin n=1 Tax=Campylobacter canis TaxID=3378588 RepID=UPI003C63464D
MKKDINYYLNLPYKIQLKRIPESEGGGWGAFMPEFNGTAFFYGDGESKAEALDELEIAFKTTLETLLESGAIIPEPISEEKRVRVNVNLPKSLLEAIDKVSSNRSKFLTDAANLKLASI